MKLNSECRPSGDRDETVSHIISECFQLAGKEYNTCHDWVGKVIDRELFKRLEFNHNNKWYMHDNDTTINHYNATAAAAAAAASTTATLIAVTPPRTWDTRGVFRNGRAKAGRPARTYIQQLCEDTGCCPEDLPRAMNDREEWRERVRDIRATSAMMMMMMICTN